MAYYLFQGGFSSESWAAQIRSPQDRTATIRQAVEGAGGRLESVYYTFGADDFVSITEFPDNVSAAAMGIRIAASGALRNVRVTPLLTAAELKSAEERAGRLQYRAPNEG